MAKAEQAVTSAFLVTFAFAGVLAVGADAGTALADSQIAVYGGWNEMSYVAAEVKNPQRNLARALIFGTLAVTVVYCLVYLAFIRVLGLEGIRHSEAIAWDMFQTHFGSPAARIMSLLVCISCLGAINGMIFTGSRISYALGKEHRLYAWLGRWNKRQDAPIRALLLQTVIAIALIVGFGWYANGFESLFNFATPVFWFFIFWVGISLFVLRYKEPDVPRPHRIALYPWLPILFCLTCAILFKSS
ncbi:MAG: amino acid permease, partial [Proteobacteria bacterium]|nr:amino acid permease [Pseudomonadota bacterium]